MSRRVSRSLAGLVRGLTAYASPWRRAQLQLLVSAALHQRHIVATPLGPLTFLTTDAHVLGGPKNVLGDEPETIEWIRSFAPGSVYWDIGGHVGQYALIAGLREDLRVLAFEPSPSTYAALCANIAENRLDGRIEAYCIAFTDATRLGRLRMTRRHLGSVANRFDPHTEIAEPTETEYEQAALGLSADDFVRLFKAPLPHYLKIDVDGTEIDILDGAATLLASPDLRSINIEHTNEPSRQNEGIERILGAAGFHATLRSRRTQYPTHNVIYAR
jgi:FkbM family methyltransferase